MRVRSQTIRHPSGIKFETPLLIPSFSSKGFKISRISDDEIRSEVGGFLNFCSHDLNDVLLVSAYDIYYKVISKPTDFPAKPAIIFIDSGGYEISDDFDSDAVNKYNARVLPWDRDKLKSIHDLWSDEIYSTIFVSYDCKKERIPLEKQIEQAKINMALYPKQLHDFLIKPEKSEDKYIYNVLNKIIGDPTVLEGFHIIGVTEKELGNCVINRMENVARLRSALDMAKITAPIHVFGSLDPVSTPLYYISGAEIFDGLSWLRYGYHEGITTNIFNYNAPEVNIHQSEEHIVGRTFLNNLSYLKELELQMKDFARSKNFSKYKFNAEVFEKCYERLLT